MPKIEDWVLVPKQRLSFDYIGGKKCRHFGRVCVPNGLVTFIRNYSNASEEVSKPWVSFTFVYKGGSHGRSIWSEKPYTQEDIIYLARVFVDEIVGA